MSLKYFDIDESDPLNNVVTWVEQEKNTLAYKIQAVINAGKKIITVVPLHYSDNILVKALIIYE